MKRKSSLEIDSKDRQILFQLDLNARMSFSELARKTRISKQMAKYRVERLEKEGFLKGYYTMIDTSSLGFTTFRVYFKYRNLDKNSKNDLINYFKSRKNAWAVVSLAGKWDCALGVAVKTIHEFYEFWDELLKEHLDKISDYNICIYSPIYHYPKKYLSDKKENFKVRIIGGKEKRNFDEKDLEILSLLSDDARLSLLDIAKELKLNPESIKYRLKQLEKKEIIQGYRAMIDVNKLGYEFYKVEMRLSKYSEIKKMIAYCQNHPNIYQVDRTIGGETLEIEFHVKSLKEMLLIIEVFETEFPKSIEKFDYLTILSEEKTTYMPKISL